MTMPARNTPNAAPRTLVLGASGRIGTGFQHVVQAGFWPGSAPLWQIRPWAVRPAGDVLEWDILRSAAPDLPPCRGIICLAGVVVGPVALNTDLALAAIDLARHTNCGPVLLTSTAAVYGRSAGPVDEDAVCNPVNDYGRAKLAMEGAVAARLRVLGPDAPPVCILRIGNVAGADGLLLAAQQGRVSLDQFEQGGGPVRSYIGMQTLADVMTGLIELARNGLPLPPVLNVATPTPMAMEDLLQAAGIDWDWQPAPATALPRMTLDTRRLTALLPLDPQSATPADLIRQARLAGWSA